MSNDDLALVDVQQNASKAKLSEIPDQSADYEASASLVAQEKDHVSANELSEAGQDSPKATDHRN